MLKENLKSNFICLIEEVKDTMCWWKNVDIGNYTIKLGYPTITKEATIGERIWWWFAVWDLHAPLKMKLVFLLSLKNKILMWDNELHRGWVGPNRCVLCNMEAEFVSHLFFLCPYTQKV
jgi:hypothetical protein